MSCYGELTARLMMVKVGYASCCSPYRVIPAMCSKFHFQWYLSLKQDSALNRNFVVEEIARDLER